ncbi:carbohydrate-binding protein [Snuella lapsa]|uniref:CBM6 domain-containing protein n=1 Tax=Snuella lapsa TaxID=870481 RepID=A0ABP6X8D5_9FLAO
MRKIIKFLLKNLLLISDLQKAMCNLVITLLITFYANAQTPDPTITTLFENAYHTWELERNAVGMYRDSKLFSGSDFHPASVANVGVGLVSLCIADAMNWETNAAQLVLKTLESVNGHTAGFTPDRNASGYFRHFIDMDTGAQAWSSEYSTIDTDLLALGAMFCKNYFSNNAQIVAQVDELWNSIDFTKAIANSSTGQIYLTMQENGEGGTALTSVYNEYMLVAWCAINDPNNDTTDAQQLWDSFYANTNNLPKSTYGGHTVLTDSNSGGFLSSFIHLFNFYMCNYFKNSTDYMNYFVNAYNADKQWWVDNSSPSYSWGHGAGVDLNGYKADKINDNADKIVSPHIIAGFLPINNNGKNDLLAQFNNNKGVYSLPDDPNKKILWRYSLSNTSWAGNSVQGIDYSTFLYGLASLPEYLGPNFFNTYNVINTGPICENRSIPGLISAEDYCTMNGVSGVPVGFIDPNDWMRYEVDIATADLYNIAIEYSSPNGGQFQIKEDGITKTTVNLPVTGGWGTYQTLNTTINLTAGAHEIEIFAVTGGFNLKSYNFTLPTPNVAPIANAGSDQVVTDTDNNKSEQVTLNGALSTDSDGTISSYDWSIPGQANVTGVSPSVSLPIGKHTITLTVTDNDGATHTDDVIINVVNIPGVIQAENWDRMSGIEGSPVGFIDAGDWLEYDINVNDSGTYNVAVHLASPDGGDQFQIKVDGVVKTTVNVSSTGGWSTYQTQSATIDLDAGTHVLQIYAVTGGYNLDWFDFSLSQWTEISYSDFENGWGIWTDGGDDCTLYNSGTFAHQGNSAANIQDNSGVTSSFYHTNGIDVSSYQKIKIEFWFRAVSMENGEDFFVEYFDGTSWNIIQTLKKGTDFENNTFLSKSVEISKTNFTFPNNAKIRFRCDASGNKDDIYIDEIRISVNALTSSKSEQTKSLSTVIDEVQKVVVQVYPNPVKHGHLINIKSSQFQGKTLIEVYDTSGRFIFKNSYKGSNIEIGTNNLKRGNYIIKIVNKDSVIVKKIYVK